MYATNAGGLITHYNKAAVEIWGYEPKIGEAKWNGASKVYDANGNSLLHSEVPTAIALKEKRAIKTKKTCKTNKLTKVF